MLTRSLLLLLSSLWTIPSTWAFFFLTASRAALKPELVHFTEAPTGRTVLDIRLDVGKTGESHLNIKDLVVELLPEPAVGKNVRGYANLPGTSSWSYYGPTHPTNKVSTGVRTMNILQPGQYITMNGINRFEAIHGSWEMIWRDGADAGSLICGLDLTQDHRRNDAVLSKDQRLFLSFPIWVRDGLDVLQQRKLRYEELAKKLKEEYYNELDKMDATDNIFMKAWHFRYAAAADEKLSLIPHRELAQIPLNDEIISLDGDGGLLLSNKGLVWARDTTSINHFASATDSIVLGTALLVHSHDGDTEETTNTNTNRNVLVADHRP